MSLPALDDITVHRGTTDPIEGVIRVETSPKEKATPIIMEMIRSVYPHDEVFGTYCTVDDYIDCPPDGAPLADPSSVARSPTRKPAQSITTVAGTRASTCG